MSKVIVTFIDQDYNLLQKEVYHNENDVDRVERFAKDTRSQLIATGKFDAVAYFLQVESE